MKRFGEGQTSCTGRAYRETGAYVRAAYVEDLIAEGEALPAEGWDFSWFEGRATSADKYRDQLLAVHEQIQRDGAFVAYSKRFLIEARKP